MIEIDQIYNEDCLEGMKRIDDASVDCIITDLPYGTTRNPWDSIIPLDKLWADYKRIIKERGAIVLFSQQPFTSTLVASNPQMFKYEWIWEKEMGTGHLNSKFAPLKIHENILVFSKSAACFVKNSDDSMVYNPQWAKGRPYKSMNGNLGKGNYDNTWDNPQMTIQDGEHYFPKDIIKFNRDKDSTLHPTQKPVDLLRYLIRTYTNPGDLVLDATIGSGTTCVAALREHRHFLGFELNKEYFNIAQRRIALERSQPTLDFNNE